jgi:7-cyano-7-deazaguanine synthase
MANLATKTGIKKETILKIETPQIHLSKAGIIKLGLQLGVDYSMTISCYDPDDKGRSCGFCDSCLHRKKGFSEAGVNDPTPYYPPDNASLVLPASSSFEKGF